MKRMRKLSMIVSTVAVCTMLTGCNIAKISSNSSEDIIYYSLGIDGNKIKIDEENKEIKGVIELSKSYIYAATMSDYTKEYDEEEFTYYTNEIKQMYEEYGVIESTAEMIQENELKTVISDINVNSVEMYTVNKEEHAQSVVEFITLQEHGTPEYLESRNIELSVRYRRTAIIKVVKEEGVWKVKELMDISDREKVE